MRLWREALILVLVTIVVVAMAYVLQGDSPHRPQPYDGPAPSPPCLASPPGGCA
jgi:hypothetical protein